MLLTNTFALIATAMLTASAAAQNAPEYVQGPVTAGMSAPKGGAISMHIEDLDTPTVKGVPFCATVTTEHTQSFVDGNSIHTSDTSTSCRDSQGRTRRDAGLNLLGAGPQTSAPKLITIVDPVAGVRYMLDPDDKVAHKMVLPSAPGPGSTGLPDKEERVMLYRNAGESEARGFSTNMLSQVRARLERNSSHHPESGRSDHQWHPCYWHSHDDHDTQWKDGQRQANQRDLGAMVLVGAQSNRND